MLVYHAISSAGFTAVLAFGLRRSRPGPSPLRNAAPGRAVPDSAGVGGSGDRGVAPALSCPSPRPFLLSRLLPLDTTGGTIAGYLAQHHPASE